MGGDEFYKVPLFLIFTRGCYLKALKIVADLEHDFDDFNECDNFDEFF